jgi:hypothetical protein
MRYVETNNDSDESLPEPIQRAETDVLYFDDDSDEPHIICATKEEDDNEDEHSYEIGRCPGCDEEGRPGLPCLVVNSGRNFRIPERNRYIPALGAGKGIPVRNNYFAMRATAQSEIPVS